MAKIKYNMPCNIADTLNLIGDRWSLLILHELFIGSETYKELQERLAGIPSNLLSQRLKALEEDGLVASVLYQRHPPRYRYVLTASSRDLGDVFNSLVLWGAKHLRPCHKKLVHKTCGMPVQMIYYCPHCGAAIDAAALTVEKTDIEGGELHV